MLKILIFTLLGFIALNTEASEPNKAVIQLNSDITVSCFFTVNTLQNEGILEYRVIGSSPRDCGSVDLLTGKLLESKVKLYCPNGYDAIGISRGGAVGSHGANIFYQAQGLCRSTSSYPIHEYRSLIPGVIN
jgi:hypothetical protein